MTICTKSIIECLRDDRIEPFAEANNQNPNNPAAYGINYENSHFFHTWNGNFQSWWMVDFKKKVTINSYLFQAGSYCAYMKYWEASVSNDNKTWTVVDSPPQQWTENKNFSLKSPTACRYFRITGLNGYCGFQMAFDWIKFYGTPRAIKPIKPDCATNYRRFAIKGYLARMIFLVYS